MPKVNNDTYVKKWEGNIVGGFSLNSYLLFKFLSHVNILHTQNTLSFFYCYWNVFEMCQSDDKDNTLRKANCTDSENLDP